MPYFPQTLLDNRNTRNSSQVMFMKPDFDNKTEKWHKNVYIKNVSFINGIQTV